MTKNTKNDIAIALKYDGKSAPIVTAKGQGELAKEIISIALANNIPLDNDPMLVKLLSSIPLGDKIPEELYIAVAEVIAFTYMLSGRVPEGFDKESRS